MNDNSYPKNPLNDIEWTTLWMSIRYACGRQTISSATLPQLIVKSYWHRMTELQKKQIYDDLKREYDNYGENAFGSPTIDKPVWLKFMEAMNEKNRKIAVATDGNNHEVFYINEKYYPLDSYVETPHQEIYLPEENIKEFIN